MKNAFLLDLTEGKESLGVFIVHYTNISNFESCKIYTLTLKYFGVYILHNVTRYRI